LINALTAWICNLYNGTLISAALKQFWLDSQTYSAGMKPEMTE